MAGGQFFRRPTEEEKQDFNQVGPHSQKSAKIMFLRELSNVRMDVSKKKLPFFKKAAMDDFEAHYQEEIKKSMRKNGYVNAADIKPIKIDWTKYSSPKYISFVEVVAKRDSAVSKKHPFDVFVNAFRYKYEGYGREGDYNMSVMEEEMYAVKRARASYENKPELEGISLAEKQSGLYGNNSARIDKKEKDGKDRADKSGNAKTEA